MEDQEIILKSIFEYNPKNKIESKCLVDYILQGAKKNIENGRKKWLTNTNTGETFNFSDIEPLSRNVAYAMESRGMKKGDIAIYLTTDVTKIHLMVVGIWRIGGCLYSSYEQDTEETLLMRVSESNAKWLFCNEESVPLCESVSKKVDWKVEIISFGAKVGENSTVDELFLPAPINYAPKFESKPEDKLVILCTSGTTGLSKGAVYTNEPLLAFIEELSNLPGPYDAPDLFCMKCTHVLGLFFPFRNIVYGTWTLMMNQLSKTNIFNAVDKYKPRLIFGFPTFLRALAIDEEAQAIDRSSLEFFVTGGIVIQQQFYDEIRAALPNIKGVMNGFGMTECGGALTTTIDLTSPIYVECKNMPPLTVGHLYPRTMLKVLDLDTGKTCGPNQRGELAFKSPITASSYWNREEETEKTFVNGWVKTGDWGYYDENGYIFISGRIKETFKYFNHHISPDELEEILLRNHEILEACVFGIKDPDGGDTIPRAAIVLKHPNSKITPNEIRQSFDVHVATYKQLRGGVFIIPSLPRGKTGKVSRILVSQLIES